MFHSWSAQAKIDPLPIARASGSYFWDFEDHRYLDFSSQLVNVNIGYQHPKLVAAIQEQAGKLCTIAPSFANDARSEAARLIAEIAPGDLNAVFFTNGGAEANENAVRMARLHTGRHKVLAAYRSYHGATAGAIALTGDPRRWPSEPGMPGIVRYWGPVPVPLLLPRRERAGGVRAGAGAPAGRHHVRGCRHGRRDRAGDRRRAPTGSSFRRTATWPAFARSATSWAS